MSGVVEGEKNDEQSRPSRQRLKRQSLSPREMPGRPPVPTCVLIDIGDDSSCRRSHSFLGRDWTLASGADQHRH